MVATEEIDLWRSIVRGGGVTVMTRPRKTCGARPARSRTSAIEGGGISRDQAGARERANMVKRMTNRNRIRRLDGLVDRGMQLFMAQGFDGVDLGSGAGGEGA